MSARVIISFRNVRHWRKKMKIKAGLPHTVHACVYKIELRFRRAFFPHHNQSKLLEKASQWRKITCGNSKCKCALKVHGNERPTTRNENESCSLVGHTHRVLQNKWRAPHYLLVSSSFFAALVNWPCGRLGFWAI